MRVFVPATIPMLEQLITDGMLMPVSGTVFSVTPSLREEYISDDEYLEVTPKSLRIRKIQLDENDRKKSAKKTQEA